ncbi:MAG TPA: YncE family protein [Frankiaceae bacterium]|nr:YncE family protein [Frankiaceae bacterium]
MPAVVLRALARIAALAVLLVTAAVACGGSTGPGGGRATSPAVPGSGGQGAARPTPTAVLPPPAPARRNVYARAGAGMLSPAVRGQRALVYVPNHTGGTVSVIDPRTLKVVDTFASGPGAQHVVPSYDMRTLWVNNNERGNSLTPIDPRTGKRRGPNVAVFDPYNMYYTPDGRSAIVVAEAEQRLDFRDPRTMRLQSSTRVDCKGVNHADFSADLSYAVFTCEFSGRLVKVDLRTRKPVAYLTLDDNPALMPQDIRLEPSGQLFWVADMMANGVHFVDAAGPRLRTVGFLPTGPETHGIYPSRDGRLMYVSNRGGARKEGSVSVVDATTRRVVATWTIPGGGTPDMGGVSVDGSRLWLSGRRDDVVYAWDTRTGTLLAKIPVGLEPHGLAVWPQPGRFSLGHTGNTR